MNVALIQSELHWEAPAKNREMFEQKISILNSNIDVIVLPEMFTTGFTMAPEKLAEKWPGLSVRWMQRIAKSKKSAIVGSLVVEENACFFNRLIFVKPEGEVITYNKRHLFRMGDEHLHYSSGSERIVVEWKGFRILLLICYDIRFPVWCRNNDDYDLIIIVANFPEKRKDAWNVLLKARAIENQCYVTGCNRIGTDGNGIAYSGESQIINPGGVVIQKAEANQNCTISADLSIDQLRSFRSDFPVQLDKDDFIIK